MFPSLHTGKKLCEDRGMEHKQAKTPSAEPRPKIRRVIVRLLRAVDRSAAAADEAREASNDLLKLAAKTKEGKP